MLLKAIHIGFYAEWMNITDSYGGMMCMCLRRKRLELPDRAALENAMAQTVANTQKGEDIEAALVELAELFAAQDDALVELAGIIEEGM